MSICRRHEQRDPIGDVSELLRPLRFERAPGPKQAVTPDQYRQWQERQSALSMERALTPPKPNGPSRQEIMRREGLRERPRNAIGAGGLPALNSDPVAKAPSKIADRIGEAIPHAIKDIKVPAGVLNAFTPGGAPMFHQPKTVGEITRKAADTVLGTGKDEANAYAQALNLAMLAVPGAKILGKGGSALVRAVDGPAGVAAREALERNAGQMMMDAAKLPGMAGTAVRRAPIVRHIPGIGNRVENAVINEAKEQVGDAGGFLARGQAKRESLRNLDALASEAGTTINGLRDKIAADLAAEMGEKATWFHRNQAQDLIAQAAARGMRSQNLPDFIAHWARSAAGNVAQGAGRTAARAAKPSLLNRAFDATWKFPLAHRGLMATGVTGWVGYEAIKRGLNGISAPEPDLSQSPGKAAPQPGADAPIKQEDFDGRKMFGPKGEVPGNDAKGNALPNVRPDVPHKAEYAPGLGALNALGNDASMNRVRVEYAILKRKVRMLQERHLPLEAGMRPDEIERWSELNDPENQTPGGRSIFEGRN